MLPRELDPPAELLTDHVTAVLVVPETVAVKEAELPARTLAVEGETATVMEGVAGGCCMLSEEVVEPQPTREKENMRSIAQKRGDGVRIDSLFSKKKERRATGRRDRRGAGGGKLHCCGSPSIFATGAGLTGKPALQGKAPRPRRAWVRHPSKAENG